MVEAALSAVIFGYTVKAAVNGLKSFEDVRLALVQLMGLLLNVLPTGCVVWSGQSNCCYTSKVLAAVGRIEAANAREAVGLRRDGPSESLGLHGVDLFEYHDIASMSLNMLQMVFMWVLSKVVFSALAIILIILAVTSCEFALGSVKCSAFFVPAVLFCSALFLGCVALLLYSCGVIGKIRNLGELFQTEPFSATSCNVWTRILVGGLVYDGVLLFSPAASVWRWGAILTHTARTLKVLYSLPRVRWYRL